MRRSPHVNPSGLGLAVEAVTRDPAGGTPRCTVVIKDELGDEYRATLPKREPQVYGS